MTQITEIEQAIEHLAPDDLARFRQWFTEFDAAAWDCQWEKDVAAGRLDALADEAVNDFRSGQCTDL